IETHHARTDLIDRKENSLQIMHAGEGLRILEEGPEAFFAFQQALFLYFNTGDVATHIIMKVGVIFAGTDPFYVADSGRFSKHAGDELKKWLAGRSSRMVLLKGCAIVGVYHQQQVEFRNFVLVVTQLTIEGAVGL